MDAKAAAAVASVDVRGATDGFAPCPALQPDTGTGGTMPAVTAATGGAGAGVGAGAGACVRADARAEEPAGRAVPHSSHDAPDSGLSNVHAVHAHVPPTVWAAPYGPHACGKRSPLIVRNAGSCQQLDA